MPDRTAGHATEPSVYLTTAELDALIGQYRTTGNDRFFARLHEELAPYIASIVLAWLNEGQRTQESVEDACQTVWLRLAVAIRGSYRTGNPGGFRPFARQVAINVCKDLNSRRRLPLVEATGHGMCREVDPVEQAPDTRPNPRDRAAMAEVARKLHTAVEALPPMHRHLVHLMHPEVFAQETDVGTLHFSPDLSQAELARAMEAEFGECFSLSRIKDMKARALVLLRQAMLRQKGGRHRSARPGCNRVRSGDAVCLVSPSGLAPPSQAFRPYPVSTTQYPGLP